MTSIFRLGVPSQQLMVLMGQVLSRNLASSCDSNPGKMLNVVWPYFSRKEDADSYLQCMDAWMPYLLRHWRVNCVFEMKAKSVLCRLCFVIAFERSRKCTASSTI